MAQCLYRRRRQTQRARPSALRIPMLTPDSLALGNPDALIVAYPIKLAAGKPVETHRRRPGILLHHKCRN
jgi:hypothetical protein